MSHIKKYALGRVLLLQWEGILDGSGISPRQVAEAVRGRGVRFLVLDTTRASSVDSNGLRWLIRVRDELDAAGKQIRVAARPQGKVWRNLKLLNLGLEVFGSVRKAWKGSRGRSRDRANDQDQQDQ